MVFKRNLRYGISGADVRYIKEQLLTLGYYAPKVVTVGHDRFGSDTLRAVLAFQGANTDGEGGKLMRDGIVGRKTWAAVMRLLEGGAESTGIAIPAQIGSAAGTAIARDLLSVNAKRRDVVLSALSYAFDPAVPARFPHSLYIYGANLFDSALLPEAVTPARIRAGAKRTPVYYSDGRMEMMLAAVGENPRISGADCSGGIVGILRKLRIVKPSFDATANMLASGAHSVAVSKSALHPGDWVGRSGHIGIYAGGGYVVEWMGGAYGCQLNRLTARAGYDFVQGRVRKGSAWTRFRRPKYY